MKRFEIGDAILLPGLTGAEGAGDLSELRPLRSAENSVPKTQ